MKLFANYTQPFIVSVCVAPNAKTTTSSVERSIRAGADIVEVNLAQLTDTEIARLRIPEKLPYYVVCRRIEFMAAYGLQPARLPARDDERRMLLCSEMINRGARAVDIECDTFAASKGAIPDSLPADIQELSVSKEAIRDQLELITSCRIKGAEIILSCHSGLALTASQTNVLAQLMVARGADVVKIVNRHHDRQYFTQAMEAIMAVRGTISCPFLITSMGPLSNMLRLTGCYLGNSYTFCRAEGATSYYPDHPKIKTVRTLWNLFPVHVQELKR